MNKAAAAAQQLDRDFAADPRTDPLWEFSAPVLRAIASFEGSAAQLQQLLQQEALRAQDPVWKVAIDTAVDILADGSQTIYNPDYWVTYMIDPRHSPAVSPLEQAGSRTQYLAREVSARPTR